MKRGVGVSVLLVIVVLFFSLSVEAQSPQMLFNGQAVDSDLIRLIKGSTMVYPEFISRYFGDQIKFNKKGRGLLIENNNNVIELEVNNRIALVNNKPKVLKVTPVLVDEKVMIPLRFLTKIYGGRLSWNAEEKLINYHKNIISKVEVKTFNKTSQVLVDMNYLTEYKTKVYSNPNKLVLDIYGVNLGQVDNVNPVNSSMIRQVRVSQYQYSPSIVRVVVDLNSMSSYHVIEKEKKIAINIMNNLKVVSSSISSIKKLNIEEQEGKEFDLIRKKIVIDAGHGGYDPGAIGVMGFKEKDVNYEISKKVKELLLEKGYNVIMTRDSDGYISLEKRADIANQINADIFISIHANSHSKITANGSETYAHWKATEDNWALAWYVHSEMVKRIKLKDNGLKAANFAVLRNTGMPAILVETGFLSNPEEEKLLKMPSFQKKVAQGIVAGIEKYYQD